MSDENHESFDSLEEMQEDLEAEISDDMVTDNNLAVGFKVPSSVKTPVGYLDDLRKYQNVYNKIEDQIKVCNKLYKYNAIVGNAVDVLVEFAVTKVRLLSTGNKKLDRIIEYFLENVNLESTNSMPGVYPLMNEIVLEWFTSGNAFPYEKWDNVSIPNVGGMSKVPVSINLLNPLAIEVPEAPIAFGQEVIYLKPSLKLMEKLNSDGRRDPEAALLKSSIPRSIVNSIRNKKHFGEMKIRLNPKFVTHLKRKSKSYQPWGVPYLTRCFSEAALLERLKLLDESIATGLTNLVTIYKVGTEEHPASPTRLRKLANLLKNPKATTTLVWAHDIEVEQVGPDGKVLQFDKKFREAKENLMIALGVPPVLSSLSASGDPWVSILALVERLEHWRHITTLWLERVCNKIADANGYQQRIKLRWDRMNLQEDAAVKNLILAFYDRGLISIKDAIEESGRNYAAIVASKQEEKTDGSMKDLFAPPEAPFGPRGGEKGRPSASDPKMNRESTNKTKTKREETTNLKTSTRKSPSSKVK